MRLDWNGVQAMAHCLGAQLQAGDRLYLHGELGAGKTAFCRALLQSLGYQGTVKSPTFNWVDTYTTPQINQDFSIAHFDLFRLENPRQFPAMGFADYFSPPWVSLVEWFDKALEILPAPTLVVSFSFVSDKPDQRDINLHAFQPRGEDMLAKTNGLKSIASSF